MTGRKLMLGIVVVGSMGLAHIDNWLGRKMSSVDIVAAADTDPSRKELFKNRVPGGTFFDDAQSLYDSGLCEAVLIATPHYFHPPLAIAAFERGLHVLSEKPAGVYTLQVRQAIEAAERTGLTYAMMFNQRTNAVFRKVREMVRGGEYGSLRRVNWIITDWFRSQAYYDEGDWRATWTGEGGGVMMNQCVHQRDLLQWICGTPCAVLARCREGKWHDIEVEDDVTMYLEFQNGATGCFVTTTGEAPGTNRLEITLERGKIVVDDAKKITLYSLPRPVGDYITGAAQGRPRDEVRRENVEVPPDDPEHPAVVEAFASHIIEGAPLVAEGKEGLTTVELIDAAYLSSWLGRKVALPIDDEEFKALLDKKIASSKAKTRVIRSRAPFTIEKYK